MERLRDENGENVVIEGAKQNPSRRFTVVKKKRGNNILFLVDIN